MMSENVENQSGRDESARQRRLDALRALGGNEGRYSLGGEVAHKSLAAHSRRRILAASLVVVLASVGIFTWLGPTHSQSPSTTPPLDASVLQFPDHIIARNGSPQPNITCPREGAWSPDGTMLAIIGAATCDGTATFPNIVLAIYMVTKGQAHATSSGYLDEAIAQYVVPRDSQNQLDAAALHRLDIKFSHLVWLPSAEQESSRGVQQLAAIVIARQVIPGQRATYKNYAANLITLNGDSNSGSAGVGGLLPSKNFLQAVVQESSQSSFLIGPEPTFRWTVAQDGTHGDGTRDDIASFDVTKANAVALPSALGYNWIKDDKLGITLNATQPLAAAPDAPPPTVTPGLIGNPTSDTSFSVWQNGLLTYGSAACSASGAASGPVSGSYYLLSLGTSAWSPDGQYLITGLGATGRLSMTSPAASASGVGSGSGGVCQHLPPASSWSQLPVRDSGLGRAAAALDLYQHSQVAVAWSPDGRRLAVAPSASALSADTSSAAGTPLLTIYDCQTGKVLTRLTLAQLKQVDPKLAVDGVVGVSSLRWSPDGQHLLLLDPTRHALVIVGPRLLGE